MLYVQSKDRKRALITGIGGQDGSYLAEFLLNKGYEVYGLDRRVNGEPYPNLTAIASRLQFVSADIMDYRSLRELLNKVQPTEIYNLTGQSSVGESWKHPGYTMDVNATAVFNLLNAIKEIDPSVKFFQASSAEMFGKIETIPQTEETPFRPQNPYGVSKLCAYWASINYRQSYNLFISNGILFNHESPRRRIDFVSRKITDGLVRIKLGLLDRLSLGNIDAQRDWGYAPEYVEAMWMMLQQETPGDYVIASGEVHTVREFLEEAARVLGMEITWSGQGVDEIGVDTVSGKTIITIDPQFYRPTEAHPQMGDPTKAKRELGWEPKVSFRELVAIMVETDIKHLDHP